MHVKFWGTRGSIPTPTSASAIRKKIYQALAGAAGLDMNDAEALEQYLDRLPLSIQGSAGGNTACVEVRSGEDLLIIDAGSGLRELGLDLMERGFGSGQQHIHILMSHTHWDHIQGFPFFAPAFIAGNSITFYCPFADLKERMTMQQHATFFPLPLAAIPATLTFQTIPEQEWLLISGFNVYAMPQSHPGKSYGYRIEDGRSCVVYASDAEYKRVDPASTEAYVQFFHAADLLIFDAQYSWTEVLDKPDWGHSTALMGAELARRAEVKRLALFHHDPTSSDEKIWKAREQAEAYLDHTIEEHTPCQVLVAYDGLLLEL